MFDVSQFTNENDASPTPLPPADSVDLDERETATKFAAQTCQIPTSSSCHSPSPKKATLVRSIVRNKITIQNNPSQSTLVQLNRVDIPPSPLKLASVTAFSTTSSRGIFNNTASNQLASPLLNDTSITHDVSLIDSSILSKKNNDLFKHRILHQITFTLPSEVDEKELGIIFDQNVRFGRVGVCGISNSSSLFNQIPLMYHEDWLLLAVNNGNKLIELERCSDAINEMNNARRGKQATISIILAEPYINTLEEALAKWEELVDKKDCSMATKVELQALEFVAAVFTDYITYVYNNKDTPDNKLYFFEDLTSFPSFDEVKEDAGGGGTYIGQASSRIPLKFGTSLTSCLNRKKRQNLKRAHLFCTLKKAQQMIPERFLNRLIALNILSFDPSQIDTALQYCATLLNEATLTVIHPSITSNVGDLLLHSISNDARLIIDPPIAQSV